MASGNVTSSEDAGVQAETWIKGIYGVIGAVGVVGNILVCAVIVRTKRLQTITNAFVFSLACTDLLASALLIIFRALPSLPSIPTGVAGSFVCSLYVSEYPLWACFYASITTLIAVTAERYIAIVKSFYYTTFFSARKVGVMIGGVWGVGFICSTYNTYWVHYSEEFGECHFEWRSIVARSITGAGILVVSYTIPIVLMSAAYYLIWNNLKKSAERLMRENASENGPGFALIRARKNVVKMLISVLVTFILCWTWDRVTFMIYLQGGSVPLTSWYYHFGVIAAFLNSCLNPFVYGFSNNHFRRGFLSMVRKPNRVQDIWSTDGVTQRNDRD